MASGGKKGEDFRNTCGLCMEPYRGRSPKLLPCFHTFCLPCLTALTKNVSGTAKAEYTADEEEAKSGNEEIEGQPENELKTGKDEEKHSGDESDTDTDYKGSTTNRGGVFLCPTCRTPITVPLGGVAALQTNFYLEMDSAGDPPSGGPVLCDMCEEDQQEKATHTCQDCHQRMCRSCRRLHDLVTGARDHRVEPITTKPAPPSNPCAGDKKFCQYHPDQVLSFHCCKCDVSICLHCKLTSHEGHPTEDMATAMIRAKEELTGVLTKASNQLRAIDTSLSRLERDEQDLKRQKREVMQKVNSNYDVIMMWATRARDEVLETLAASEQISQDDIAEQMRSARIMKETMSGIVSRAAGKMKLGPDLVLLKSELQAALLSDDTFDHYKKLGSRKEQQTFFPCIADPTVLDLPTIRLYVGELLEGETTGTDTKPSSFSELATSVAKLEAAMKEKPEVRVSFHVVMTGTYSYSAGQRAIFNAVHCNEGNGYNSGNGIFTAPEAGTYLLMATVRNQTNGQNYYVQLYVKNTVMGNNQPPESSSVHVVARLNKGDQVWVQVASAFTCWANCTMFSGAMISL